MIKKLKELESTLTVTLGGRMMQSPDKENMQEIIKKVNEIVEYLNEEEDREYRRQIKMVQV